MACFLVCWIIMLISVHLPKTGGVTFRSLLQKHYGEALLLDYQDRPMSQASFQRNLSAFSNMLQPWQLDTKKYDCVHGHFLPLKYQLIKQADFITWFRHPVERVVSRYYYMQRTLSANDAQRRYIKDQHINLEAFCQIPHYHNLYAKYLVGMPLEKFRFIGITEDYDNSLTVFKHMFKLDHLHTPPPQNTNPEQRDHKLGKYAIPEKLEAFILQSNAKDYEIYQAALRINRRLQASYL